VACLSEPGEGPLRCTPILEIRYERVRWSVKAIVVTDQATERPG
jgi:hypothetical protein